MWNDECNFVVVDSLIGKAADTLSIRSKPHLYTAQLLYWHSSREQSCRNQESGKVFVRIGSLFSW